MPSARLFREVLGEGIRGVVLARNLLKADELGSDGLLQPQRVCLKVSNLPETLALDDTQGSASISVEPAAGVAPEVTSHGPAAQSSLDARTVPYSSASAEESETKFCIRDQERSR